MRTSQKARGVAFELVFDEMSAASPARELRVMRRNATNVVMDSTVDTEALVQERVTNAMRFVQPRHGLSRDDLLQEARLAVMAAMPRFDAARGASVRTFLYNEVSYALRDAIRRADPIPERSLSDLARIRAAEESLHRDGNSEPTLPELAQRAGLSISRVNRVLHDEALSRAEGYPDSDADCADRTVETPEGMTLTAEERSRVVQIVDSLPVRDRMMLILRFVDGMSQTQIARSLGVSEACVSKSLSRVRKELRVLLSE